MSNYENIVKSKLKTLYCVTHISLYARKQKKKKK